jgi:hypothetical protein
MSQSFDGLVEGIRNELVKLSQQALRAMPGTPRKTLAARVEIVTSGAVLDECRREVRALTEHVIRVDLPGFVLDAVSFTRQAGLSEPRVLITTADRFAPIVPADETSYRIVRERHAPALRLDLCYENLLHWAYDIPSRPHWVPLGRGVASTGAVVPLRLPNVAFAVPCGGLVEVRQIDGCTEWRRSRVRTEYSIEIDGSTLYPTRQKAGNARGNLAYVGADGARTTLAYQCSPKELT